MNVQDVIDKALAGNDGIPVTPVEHSSCEDVQVEKLASALNFIATNLESSFDDLEKEASRKKRKRRSVSPDERERRGAQKTRAKVENSKPKVETPYSHLPVKKSKKSSKVDVPPSFMKRHATKLKVGAGLTALGGLALGVNKYRNRNQGAQKKTASVDDVLYHAAQAGKQALLEKNANHDPVLNTSILGSTAAGGVGAHLARRRMREAGISEEEINDLVTRTSGTGRGLGTAVGGALVGEYLGDKLGMKPGLGSDLVEKVVPSALSGLATYKSQTNRADRAIKRHKARQKTASFTKVAEDRINPAKISAGAAAPYSGEIMPNAGQVSNEFVGNTRDHHALIALKAQKVRDRINKDMKQYVNNVGDGYNLQGHLNKMNK